MTMPSLWDRTPKAHISVMKDIRTRMLSTWTNDQIWDEVAKSDIQDDDDQIVTWRALRLIRDEWARIRRAS